MLRKQDEMLKRQEERSQRKNARAEMAGVASRIDKTSCLLEERLKFNPTRL